MTTKIINKSLQKTYCITCCMKAKIKNFVSKIYKTKNEYYFGLYNTHKVIILLVLITFQILAITTLTLVIASNECNDHLAKMFDISKRANCTLNYTCRA